MNRHNADPATRTGRKISAGAAVLLTTTLLAACGATKSETEEYSNTLPSWLDGSHNVCAVELGGRYDSLDGVNAELTKDDSGFQGRSILISAQPKHIGQVVNLNFDPSNDQQPGDKVLATNVSAVACQQAGGEYGMHPEIVAQPSPASAK